MAEVQNKATANQLKAMEIEKKYEDKEKDRQLKRNLAVLDLAGDLARNPTSQPIVDRTITRMAPSMARRQSKLGGGAVLARPPPHRPLPGLHGPMMGPTF